MFKLQFLFYFAFIKWKISNPEYLYRRTAAKKKIVHMGKNTRRKCGPGIRIGIFIYIYILFDEIVFFELWIFYL